MKSKVIYETYLLYEDGRLINKLGKELRWHEGYSGYLITQLTFKGKRIGKSQHRLLAETFIPNPNNLTDVDHIDGDRKNNKLTNLRWLSHGENIKHSYNLKNRSATGINNARCTTDEQTVKEICVLLEKGLLPAKIRDLGYDYSTVRKIRSRENWSSISKDYNW